MRTENGLKSGSLTTTKKHISPIIVTKPTADAKQAPPICIICYKCCDLFLISIAL